MKVGRVISGVLQGMEFIPVMVEVTASSAENSRFVIVGLADTAIREAKERVLSALSALGVKLPNYITVNLAPAEVKKEGTGFDLPIALAVLVAARQISPLPQDRAVFGELSLDGKVRPISGVLALGLGAEKKGFSGAVVPKGNALDLVKRENFSFWGTESLSELLSLLKNNSFQPLDIYNRSESKRKLKPFSGIVGQGKVKRALTIAVAGGHNFLMVGPPGCGKSFLASRVPHLLPPLSEKEQYEVLFLKSLSRGSSRDLSVLPPFRAPHHTVSEAGLIGGGSPPRPGEITMAHRGVLFLDELPEFKRSALEALRAPLEAGYVEISRVKGKERYPARFQLIAAMNPCPCGYLGETRCSCSKSSIQRYLSKLSGPILDRFDLQLAVERVDPFKIRDEENDEIVLDKITSIRELQLRRSEYLNGNLPAKEVFSILRRDSKLSEVLKRTNLTMRGIVRVVRVARSISDWEGKDQIGEDNLREALSFRNLDRLILTTK